ncbi:hypothetical protein [Dyella koreensis]|uniref:Uncharacterized protein n=1 Tax=Dyella koreensis TaxID=311235 RepID=A0ABW8K158_9GAMM
MNRSIALGLVFSALATNVALAQTSKGTLELEVSRASEGELEVVLKNRSSDRVKVSAVFNENPAFGVLNFNLSEGGHRYGPTFPPNENLPTDSAYISLGPGDAFGHIYSIADLMHSYEAKSACVTLVVTYRDRLAAKFRAFDGSIKARPIRICSSRQGQVRGV